METSDKNSWAGWDVKMMTILSPPSCPEYTSSEISRRPIRKAPATTTHYLRLPEVTGECKVSSPRETVCISSFTRLYEALVDKIMSDILGDRWT